MKFTVDRIEGNYAVCEDERGSFHNIPKDLLPNVREGDVLDEENGKFTKNEQATQINREKIIEIQRGLWE